MATSFISPMPAMATRAMEGPHPTSKGTLFAIWDAWENESSHGMSENRAQAVIRLKEYYKFGVKEVDLSKFNLSALPPLQNGVTTIDLSGNKILSLPENIPEGVMFINLSGNSLHTLPDNIPTGLMTLDVGDNPHLKIDWKKLPPSLKRLWVNGCSINNVPEPCDMSCELEQLHAAHNPGLVSIPDDIWTTVKKIDISWCDFSVLPEKHPAQLEALYATGNSRLKELPSALLASKQIDIIRVPQCGLTEFPKKVPPNLALLDISDNAVGKFPETGMPRVCELIADNCGFKNLPNKLVLPSIPSLQDRSLSLRGNELSELPLSLKYSPRYWTIDLRNNPLSDEAIGNIQKWGREGPHVLFGLY